jgi:hypothetical protein
MLSEKEFIHEFGSYSDEATRIVTQVYHMMTVTNNQYQYHFDLEKLFTESIDLFSVDLSLVKDYFVINTIFADESILPSIIMTLTELVQRNLDYDPITEKGEFWLTFSDIRRFYGEEKFDKEMLVLFPHDYNSFKDYMLE